MTKQDTTPIDELYEKVEACFDLHISSSGASITIKLGGEQMTVDYEAFLELRKKIEALISDQVREELTNLKIARINLDKITTDHADGYQMAIDDMNRHIDNRIKELEESK